MNQKLLLLLFCCALISPAGQARVTLKIPHPHGVNFVSAAAPFAPDPPLRLATPRAGYFQQRIKQAEYRAGPYGDGLSEILLDAANYLLSRGDTDGAIPLLERALHLIRINDGLHSDLQRPHLEQLLELHVQRGDFVAVEEVQNWLFKQSLRHRVRGDPDWISAVVRYADWQRRQWLRNPDPEKPGRLYRSWSLLDRQMPTAEEPAMDDRAMVQLVLAQLRMLYTVAASDFGLNRGTETLLGRSYGGVQAQPNVARSQIQYLQNIAFSRGRRLLEALTEQLQGSDDERLRAQVYRELGDWLSWHGKYRRAAEAWEQSWHLLESAGASLELQAWYAQPVGLPAGGVLYLPDREAEGPATALLAARFDVTEQGRVRKVQIESADPAAEGSSYHLPRQLRGSRFRPRLHRGRPVLTEGFSQQYRLLEQP